MHTNKHESKHAQKETKATKGQARDYIAIAEISFQMALIELNQGSANRLKFTVREKADSEADNGEWFTISVAFQARSKILHLEWSDILPRPAKEA
jgi:hypothetical protein